MHQHVISGAEHRRDARGNLIATYRCECGARREDSTNRDGYTWIGTWSDAWLSKLPEVPK